MDLAEKLKYWRERGAPGLITPRSNVTPIIGEEGSHRGTPVGTRTEHWSDQVDSTVRKYDSYITPLGQKAIENVANEL